MSSINTVLLLGKPASGKGTQAKFLIQERGWRHVATGDHLRALVQRNDHLGMRIRKALATGELLPTPLMTHLLMETLMGVPPEEGLVLDGFGRTASQALELHEMLAWHERPYLAIHVDVPDDVATERMLARAGVEERTDSDTPEKIARRLEIYRSEFTHIAPRFASWNVLRGVDGKESPETVHRIISGLLR